MSETTPAASAPGTPAQPVVTPPAAPIAPETISVTKADWDRANGTIGDLQQKLKTYTEADKKRDDEKAKANGEYEKLILQRDKEIEALKPYQDRYTTRVASDHDRRMKALEKADAKVRARFQFAVDGQALPLETMEANLARLDEYESIGIIGGAPGAAHVVVPAASAPATPAAQVKSGERRPGLAW